MSGVSNYDFIFAAVGKRFVLLSPSNFSKPYKICVPIDAILDVYADCEMRDCCQVKFRQVIRVDETDDPSIIAEEGEGEPVEDYMEEVVIADLKCPMSYVLSILAQF